VIGHRGGGADRAAKTGAYHRTHIRENTILSFVTAASLGAQYVEFDVHLTKDLVPIIYHDFKYKDPITEMAIPLNTISLEQFRRLAAMHAKRESARIRSYSLEDVVHFDDSSPKGRSPPSLTRAAAGLSSTSLGSSAPATSSSSVSSVTVSPPSSRSPNSAIHTIEDTFPTLEECFKKIPSKTGFNIEVKYPHRVNDEDLGYRPFGRNSFIDHILQVVFDHAGDREIIFSSFNADMCVLLRMKQPRYPVFFLTEGGVKHHPDPRCNSIQAAISFAKSARLMGIVSNCSPLIRCPEVIHAVKRSGLMLCTYGSQNNDADCCFLQESLGVDAVIVDHVTYISHHMKAPRNSAPSSPIPK